MPSATTDRLSVTDGPANRERVKTPATAVGRSDTTTQKSVVSSFTPRFAVMVEYPCGSFMG